MDEVKLDVTRTTSTSGGDSYSEGAAVEVIRGSDGKLIKVVTHSTAGAPTAYPTILKIVDGNTTVVLDVTGLTITSAATGKSLVIDASLLEEDMALVEDDVCDSGTPRRRLIIASAPYDP